MYPLYLIGRLIFNLIALLFLAVLVGLSLPFIIVFAVGYIFYARTEKAKLYSIKRIEELNTIIEEYEKINEYSKLHGYRHTVELLKWHKLTLKIHNS